MPSINKAIQNITPESFAKYGVILDFSPSFDGAFEILVREAEQPWRMAVYRPANRTCDCLENHPTSMESFEPVRGTSLLIVAAHDTPNDFEIFLLDTPVCLHKGIWHNAVALSDGVLIRVNENLEVSSDFHNLHAPVGIRCIDTL